MSVNWLQKSVIGLSLALFLPAVADAQDEAHKSTTVTLDTVVVTASRTEESLREVTANVTVITEEMVQKSTAVDMHELLRQQGFDVSGSNAGGKQLRIRGMESPQMNASDISSRVLVLINGQRFGGPNLDFIGLANVERIEIIRGPSAVQYGPSAMGGVVNIITKRGSENTEIRAEMGGGSYGQERLKLAASGRSDNGLIDFSIWAGHQYRGDYKTGKGWVWEGTSIGDQNSFNGDLGINFLENHRIGINYNYFEISGSESPYSDVDHFNPSNPGFSGKTIHDMTNSNVALTYDGTNKDKDFSWQGKVSIGKLEDKAEYYSPMLGSSYSTTITRIKNVTGMMGYDNGGILALSGGADYIIYKIDTGAQPEYKDFGAFLSGKLRFLEDSLIFSAGGRFDSYSIDRGVTSSQDSKSKTNVSPSIGVAYLPIDWLKLRSNYSHGFRMPTPTELWGSSSYLPNTDLNPEKSKTWEVGVDVNWNFFNAGLTYFHSKWDDKIAGVNTGILNPGGWPPGTNWWRYENIKGATIAGFELALSADLGKAFHQDFTLRPYASLTYLPTLRNKDHGGGPMSVETLGFDTLPNTSKITMAIGLDFIEPNIDLKANVNASYAGSKRSLYWHDGSGDWLKYTPGMIVGMSAEKRVMKFGSRGQMNVRLELNNIFNKYDEGYLSYPGPGRNFYLGLVYKY